jgi:MSHA biogenesis protein MshK
MRRKAPRNPSSFILHPSSLALCLALLAPGTALAQVATDPTRPPAGFDTGAVDATGDAGGGATLQSVLISPTQKAAIIGGVMVRLGEKYGDAVLVKVAENEVVLKSGSGLQVLRLHPGVEKREIVPVANKSAQRRAKATTGTAPAAAGGAQAR